MVAEIGQSWDWSRYADMFTEDATYVEHAMGNLSGRESIRDWIVSTMKHVSRQRNAGVPGVMALD